MPSVLFVCTANICRSPMAEALLKEKVKNLPDAEKWHIASAGTWADDGNPAALFTQQLLLERGIDIRAHRSQPVSRDLLEEFNLILTMERNHKEALNIEFPEYAGRIFMISDLTGVGYDIADPIGGPLYDYEITLIELENLIERGFSRIVSLAQDPP